MARKKKKGYFVDPAELLSEILLSKKEGILTNRALNILFLMAKEASKELKYKEYQDRQDCIAFAMEDVWKYWRGFDPNKSNNAFAYYTSMIKNGFAKGFNKLHPIRHAQKVSISQESGVYNF